jgi:hypothetical protein
MKSPVTATLLVICQIAISVQPAFAQQPAGHTRPPGTPSQGPAVPRPQPGPEQPAAQPASDPVADANKAGHDAGLTGGDQEARERAPKEGTAEGFEEGREQGFNRCAAQERQQWHDQGYAKGYQDGQSDGQAQGEAAGTTDGQNAGINQGNIDGDAAANADANTAGTADGTALGTQQADQSDATTKGTADGTKDGDAAAYQYAWSTVYQGARAAYRAQMYAKTYQDGGTFPQKPPVRQLQFAPPPPRDSDRDGRTPTPNYTYLPHAPSYPTQAQTDAYNTGAKDGYNSGFDAAYPALFDAAANEARPRGDNVGCEAAKSQQYPEDYKAGYVQGKNQGYSDGYNRAHQIAYNAAYQAAYTPARQSTYTAKYTGYYDQYKEAARAAAYSAEYQRVYNAAYGPAKKAQYDKALPGYSGQATAKANADEAQDFVDRPLRVIDAQVTETIKNGIFEPGEALRVTVTLRNFSPEQVLKANDVQLTLAAVDATGSTVSVPKELLVKDLQPNTQTVVTEALEFYMDESSVDQTRGFTVGATYQARSAESASVQVNTQWLAKTSVVEPLHLQEGLPGQIGISVANNSTQVDIASGSTATLTGQHGFLDVPGNTGTQMLGSLAASGGAAVALFPVILRANGDTVKVPLAVTVADVFKRRIGLLVTAEEAATENDYKIDEDPATLPNLRTAGITRVTYKIRNISSRLVARSLHLKATIVGDNPNQPNFKILGPNPQYLNPITQGQETYFEVPILSNASNGGGTIQLEVTESGRPVVTRQTDF